MANEEHLAILQQALDAKDINIWNIWREANPDIRPNLSEANLVTLDLRNINLQNSNLNGIRVHRSNLAEAKFSNSDLFEAKMSATMLWGCDFTKANLQKSNLNMACLFKANLSESDLTKSSMNGTILGFSNLKGATLHSANMGDADLHGANLENADLSSAYLTRTNLTGTNLYKANFSEAKVAYTVFGDANISDAIGLKSVIHHAPSTIGIDTLYKSGDQIPPEFLHGCGIPLDFTNKVRSLVKAGYDYYSCFISFSTADEEFAELLKKALEDAGIERWYYQEQILPGERLDATIHHGILKWDKFIFCASKSSLTEKWWVDFEVEKALKKTRDLQRKRGEKIDIIIPLNLDGYIHSPEYKDNPKQSIFEEFSITNFEGWENDKSIFEREVKRVILALRTDGGKDEPPESKLVK